MANDTRERARFIRDHQLHGGTYASAVKCGTPAPRLPIRLPTTASGRQTTYPTAIYATPWPTGGCCGSWGCDGNVPTVPGLRHALSIVAAASKKSDWQAVIYRYLLRDNDNCGAIDQAGLGGGLAMPYTAITPFRTAVQNHRTAPVSTAWLAEIGPQAGRIPHVIWRQAQGPALADGAMVSGQG